MKSIKYIRIGIITLILIAGLSILAVGAFTADEKSHHKKHWDGVKGEYNKSSLHECGEYKEKHHSLLMEKLGLLDDATDAQIHEALKEKKQQWYEQNREKLLEKLGLSEDASNEEVKEAIAELKKNKYTESI